MRRKLQKTHLRLYSPQSACLMLKFRTVQDWTRVAFLERLPAESWKKIKVLQQSSKSKDLGLIEMLCQDLNRPVHKLMPAKLIEMKQQCKEEWAKIPQ